MAKPVIIFDFDGTLADSVPIIRAIYTEMAIKNNWRTLTDKDYEALRRGSLFNAWRWTGIPLWKYPSIIRAGKKLMKLESEKVKLFPGILELINELYKADCEIYVLSRNTAATINQVLERYELQDKVQIIRHRKRSLGNKAKGIKKLLRQKKYKNQQIWMVGDEVRDIRAANVAGVKSIAVAWGLQDPSVLEKFGPSCTATTVKELKQILFRELNRSNHGK